MKESLRPKYLLMKTHKSKKGVTLNKSQSHLKSYFKNSSGQLNSTQTSQPKKIQEFKGQIQGTIWKINSQSKKNIVLKTLIGIMKKQTQQYQYKSKKTEQNQSLQESKLVSKINYDVDKILHKNNEELANLACLKEEISSKRSQRVVFSNIFRKIQTQLKNAMITLQKQIIKSETMKTYIQNNHYSRGIQPFSITNTTQVAKNQQDQLQGQRSNEAHQQYSYIYHLHAHQEKSTKKRNAKQQRRQSKFITECHELLGQQRHTKQNLLKIMNRTRQHEFQIQKIIHVFNCSNYEEAQAFAWNIQAQNQELQQQLETIEINMCDIQRQEKIIINQRKTCQIVEQNSLPKTRLRIHQLKSYKNTSGQIESPLQTQQTNHKIIQEMFQLLNINQDNQLQKLQQKVYKLDQKLQIIIQQTQQQNETRNFDSHTSLRPLSQQIPLSMNNQLNTILQKMQIINQSQKLYEKHEFLEAYKRQMLRFIKKDNKKSR